VSCSRCRPCRGSLTRCRVSAKSAADRDVSVAVPLCEFHCPKRVFGRLVVDDDTIDDATTARTVTVDPIVLCGTEFGVTLPRLLDSPQLQAADTEEGTCPVVAAKADRTMRCRP
jgi:hypothetical protein